MVFSSALFLVYFFPIFLIIYFITKKEYKNIVAVIASLLFYAFGGKLFTFLLLVTILLDYVLVKRMNTSKGEEKTFLLIVSLVLNVGLLLYFKYTNFFIDVFYSISGKENTWLEVALPIGISFFTFQKISYTLDVYRGTDKPLNNLVDYTLFVLLFPQLIAGPIVRYNEIASELENREKNDTIDYKIIGLFRFSVGLAKKVLIANVLGESAEHYFSLDASTLSTAQAWFGVLLYSFQIYFDFSGYSDMAIGIGKMLGFNFPENFNFPYVAKNITDFWRRWHMTLSRWMRDYLFIPLGGNKVPNGRLYFNLIFVFLISGLWHGASWNFILWGGFHGFFLILDRLFLKNVLSKIGVAPSVVFTFLIVMLGWVLFKTEDLPQAISYYKSMFLMGNGTAIITTSGQVIFILVVAFLSSFWALVPSFKLWLDKKITMEVLEEQHLPFVAISTFVLISLSLVYVAASGFNPFIYFRF